MFAWLRRHREPVLPPAEIPAGQRVYAIGDVHGRLDLLEQMVALVRADDAARGPADTTIIMLGDLIDRGPDSAAVVERVIALREGGWPVRAIMGNHEEVLLAALAGDADQLRRLLRFGGVPTIESYGITLERLEQEVTEADGLALVERAIPSHHRRFLGQMEQVIAIGDYLFVHAGIRPGMALEDQAPEDLRWIRKPFLAHKGSFGPMVVHGHSIRSAPDFRSNRLGIDTGAYRTGRLTALGLEGADRWTLQTEPTEADLARLEPPAED